jgi:hypothetical protein
MTFLEIYDMRFNSGDLKKKILVACIKAANDIIFEDPATEDHVLRFNWAKRALAENQVAAERALWGVCSNATIQSTFPLETDEDVQFVVNSLIPSFLV